MPLLCCTVFGFHFNSTVESGDMFFISKGEDVNEENQLKYELKSLLDDRYKYMNILKYDLASINRLVSIL